MAKGLNLKKWWKHYHKVLKTKKYRLWLVKRVAYMKKHRNYRDFSPPKLYKMSSSQVKILYGKFSRFLVAFKIGGYKSYIKKL